MIEDTSDEYIEDPLNGDDEIAGTIRYAISSYGADMPVDGVISRLDRNDIFIPQFQRNFVWNQAQASRFIESLLLGLPVPGGELSRQRAIGSGNLFGADRMLQSFG